MSFVQDMAANAVGGLVTAGALGAWATRFAVTREIRANDERVADLAEDNRRWIRDRNADLEIAARRTTNEMAAQGQLYSGAILNQHAHIRRQALQDYRDEITRKRRRYAAAVDSEGRIHRWLRRRMSAPLARFELTPDEQQIVASWRVFEVPGGSGEHQEVGDDPTSVDLEPDLRRFEREGDPAPAGGSLNPAPGTRSTSS